MNNSKENIDAASYKKISDMFVGLQKDCPIIWGTTPDYIVDGFLVRGIYDTITSMGCIKAMNDKLKNYDQKRFKTTETR